MTAWLQNVYDTAKSSAAAAPAATDPESSAATSTSRPQADRALDRRYQIQRMRRIAADEPEQRAADGEVGGVCIAGGNHRRPDRRLERSGVPEIEAGKQRRVIERERNQGDDERRYEGAANHAADSQRAARLAAMTPRTSSSGRAFST